MDEARVSPTSHRSSGRWRSRENGWFAVRAWWHTLPLALGIVELNGTDDDDTERIAAALVREARRLKVPRRA